MSKLKVPYIRLIEALVLGNMPYDGIRDILDELEMPILDKTSVSSLQKDLLKSYKKFHGKESALISVFPDMLSIEREWVEKRELSEAYAEYFTPTYAEYRGVVGARKMYSDPLLNRSLRALALAGFNETDIELHTNGKYEIEFDSRDYIMFFRYFFNVNEWTIKERKAYVSSQKWDNYTTKVFKQALLGDKPKLLWQLGFSPGIPMNEMLLDMTNDTYFHFKMNIQDSPEESMKWAGVFKSLKAQLDKVEENTQDQADQYQEMVFKIQGTDVDTEIVNIEDTDAEIPEGDIFNLEEVDPDIIDKDELDSLG